MPQESWDPDTVLKLVHPMRGWDKCTGRDTRMSVFCGRRCMNQSETFQFGRRILGELAKMDASEAVDSPDIVEAAYYTICWEHKDQLDEVLGKWNSRLLRWASKNGKRSSVSREHQSATDSGAASRCFCETRSAAGQETGAKRRKVEPCERCEKAVEEIRLAFVGVLRDRYSPPPKEDISFQEMLYFLDGLEATLEANSWARSWNKYQEKWEESRTNTSKECVTEQGVPWPVKSGLLIDVSIANIKLFFQKAPPESLIGAAEDRFKFISAETKRWHTDKMMQHFGADIHGEFQETFKMIAKVMVELRQDSQNTRRN